MAANSILANMAVQLSANVSDFQRGMASARKELAGFKKAGEALKGLGENMAKYLSAPLAGFAAVAVKSFGDIQALKKGLEAVAGSASEADKQFNSLKKVAQLPGLGLEEAVKGSINLQAIGFSAAKAEKSIAVMGNAIATVGGGRQELERALHGLQQLANTDFPLGEDLNILKEAIPQITPLLKDAFGTARSEELQKLGVSSKQVIDVITQGLGKLAPVSGGVKNAFENLSDSSKIAMATIGEAINKNLNIEGVMNALAEKMSALAEGFNRLTPGVQKFIIVSGALIAAVGPVLVVFGAILTAIPSMVAGYTALQIGTLKLAAATKAWLVSYAPLIIQIAAITAAVAALALIAKSIYDSWGAVSGFFVRLWSEIKLTFANGLLSIIKSVNAVGSKIGVEFKGAEAALQSFANSAKANLDATPYVSFGSAVGAVGQSMTDNLNEGMAKIKSLFFQSGEDANTSAAAITTAGDATITSFKKQGAASDELKKHWESLKDSAVELAKVRIGDQYGSDTGLNGSSPFLNNAESAVKFKKGSEFAPTQVNPIENLKNQVAEADAVMSEFAGRLNDMLKGAVVDSFIALGDAIATSVNGGGMQAALNGFLTVILDFVGQFGKILIQMGLAKTSFDTLIASVGGGPAAVVAGIALVALAGVGKGLLSKGPGGATPSAPKSASPSYGSPGTSQGFGQGRVEFEIAGDKLKGVLDRTDYRAGRFSGN